MKYGRNKKKPNTATYTLESKQAKFLGWVYSNVMLQEFGNTFVKELISRILSVGTYNTEDKEELNKIRKQYMKKYEQYLS